MNGYFDLTKGNTNEDWQKMQSDGLVWAKAFNMKGELVVNEHAWCWIASAHSCSHEGNFVEIWNSIVQREDDLSGLPCR